MRRRIVEYSRVWFDTYKSLSLSLLVFNVTCNDITVIQCIFDGTDVQADWRRSCTGLRSGSQRHRHFVGFLNVIVLHRHGTTLFIWWFRHTAPFGQLLRYAGDTEDVFSTKSPVSSRGDMYKNHIFWDWTLARKVVHNISEMLVNFNLKMTSQWHFSMLVCRLFK